MGPAPSCSAESPSNCGCSNAGLYTSTPDYAYCQDYFNNNNCCVKMGDKFADYNQTYKAFNCYTPNYTAISANSTRCNDPTSWIQPMTCKPVWQLYKALGFFTYGGDSVSCCGKDGVSCDDKNHVIAIDWSFKKPNGKRLLPDIFGDWYGFKSLKLSGNMIYGSIPASINNLASLEYLNLSHNALTGPFTVIDTIKLSKLKVLDISYNKLGDSVPDNLANLTNLENLSFGNNRFSGRIPDALLTKNISLQYNQYNRSKPTEAALANNRRKNYLNTLSKARDLFDQVAIGNEEEIKRMCPMPYSRALANLYRSYLSTSQSATVAVDSVNNIASSKAAVTLVKSTLIAAFKLEIFASSKFCRGKKPWGYNGLFGSSRWNIVFPSCAAPNQSPVNFETHDTEMFKQLNNSNNTHFTLYPSLNLTESVFAYEKLSISGQGKVIIGSKDPLVGLKIGDNFYRLFLTEIHSSSEHRIDARDFAAEAQFYFRKDSSENTDDQSDYSSNDSNDISECFLAGAYSNSNCKVSFNNANDQERAREEIVAIGALIQIADQSSDFISQVAMEYSTAGSKLNNSSGLNINTQGVISTIAPTLLPTIAPTILPATAPVVPPGFQVSRLNYSSVFSTIQNFSTFYTYKGSYTSPPCFENINWLVSTTEILTISVEDLKKIQQVQGFNSRDTQPFGLGRDTDIFKKK